MLSKPPVRTIENYPTDSGDVPQDPIIIEACGELSPDDPCLVKSTEGDCFEDDPNDEDDEQSPEDSLRIAKIVREIGSQLFKEGKFQEALQKYQSKNLQLFSCPVYS
jgi:peptidyl-prolyl isomerase D